MGAAHARRRDGRPDDGRPGDVADGRPGEAVNGEERLGGVQDPLPRVGGSGARRLRAGGSIVGGTFDSSSRSNGAGSL